MGLRRDLRLIGRTHPRPRGLALALQPPPKPQRARPQAARSPTHRADAQQPSRVLQLALACGVAEQRAGDDEALDLARALVDLGDLGVAVVALGREVLGVAVAAQDLDRLAGPVTRDARGEELGLRSLDAVGPAGLLQA